MSKFLLTLRWPAGAAANLRVDLNADFLISLIARPLSFGIATASGFPPIAGVLCSIVGGRVVSRLSGVPLGMPGPVIATRSPFGLASPTPGGAHDATLSSVLR